MPCSLSFDQTRATAFRTQKARQRRRRWTDKVTKKVFWQKETAGRSARAERFEAVFPSPSTTLALKGMWLLPPFHPRCCSRQGKSGEALITQQWPRNTMGRGQIGCPVVNQLAAADHLFSTPKLHWHAAALISGPQVQTTKGVASAAHRDYGNRRAIGTMRPSPSFFLLACFLSPSLFLCPAPPPEAPSYLRSAWRQQPLGFPSGQNGWWWAVASAFGDHCRCPSSNWNTPWT